MKKFAVTDENGIVLYETDDILFFDSAIAVNYPLGNFVSMEKGNGIIAIHFENYSIVITE